MRKLSLAAASIAMGAAAALAVPMTAQAATSADTSVSAVAATWQQTGEAYTTSSRCWADADYYLAASNVYDYTCRKIGSLWYGYVLAD
ncbi:hypothetical protein ACWD4G_19530 [Streptomyces sp. NPDC002643]